MRGNRPVGGAAGEERYSYEEHYPFAHCGLKRTKVWLRYGESRRPQVAQNTR